MAEAIRFEREGDERPCGGRPLKQARRPLTLKAVAIAVHVYLLESHGPFSGLLAHFSFHFLSQLCAGFFS